MFALDYRIWGGYVPVTNLKGMVTLSSSSAIFAVLVLVEEGELRGDGLSEGELVVGADSRVCRTFPDKSVLAWFAPSIGCSAPAQFASVGLNLC
jgi:hypothetical protein